MLTASMKPVDHLPAASTVTTLGLGFLSAMSDNIPRTELAIKDKAGRLRLGIPRLRRRFQRLNAVVRLVRRRSADRQFSRSQIALVVGQARLVRCRRGCGRVCGDGGGARLSFDANGTGRATRYRGLSCCCAAAKIAERVYSPRGPRMLRRSMNVSGRRRRGRTTNCSIKRPNFCRAALPMVLLALRSRGDYHRSVTLKQYVATPVRVRRSPRLRRRLQCVALGFV